MSTSNLMMDGFDAGWTDFSLSFHTTVQPPNLVQPSKEEIETNKKLQGDFRDRGWTLDGWTARRILELKHSFRFVQPSKNEVGRGWTTASQQPEVAHV